VHNRPLSNGPSLRRRLGIGAAAAWLLLAGAPATAERQKHPPAPLILSFETALEQQRDDLLVPLRFSGGRASLGLGSRWDRGPREHRLAYTVSAAGFRDRFDAGGAGTLMRAEYHFLQEGRDLGPLKLALGGRLDAMLRDNYFIAWDETHIYWVTTFAAGPAARLALALGNGTLRADCAADFGGIVARPPLHRTTKIDSTPIFSYHFKAPLRNLETRSPREHFRFDWGLSCRKQGRRIEWEFGYAGSYQRTLEPRSYFSADHGITLRLFLRPFNRHRELPCDTCPPSR